MQTRRKCCRSLLALVAPFTPLLLFVFLLSSAQLVIAQSSQQSGSISGTVTADQGTVRGFRVRAYDPVRRVAYTVFTRAGRYRVPELAPGTYEVRVLQANYESPAQKVDLKPAESKKVDLAIKYQQPKPSQVELVDYDTLYPPGPGRDLLAKNCMGCHGKLFYQKKGPLTIEGWRQMVEMTDPKSPKAWGGIETVPDLTAEQKETIAQYLAANFGPKSPRRDAKLDELVIDEDQVANSLYIEWDLPEPSPLAEGKRRGLHSPYVAEDGMIWYTDTGANSILGLNPREMSFEKRFKDFPVTGAGSVGVDGLAIDSKGYIYWTELRGHHLGELDPKTGEITRHKIPSLGSMHTPRVDSKDNVWYTLLRGSKLGRLDAKTRQITQLDLPTFGSDPYGIMIDQNDKIWVAALNKHKIVKYDPATSKFTEYPTPTQPSGRRIGVDSKGTVWFSEYGANQLGALDPKTGKITEYKFPLTLTHPYETWPDNDDIIWTTDEAYKSFIKFDPRTKKFTYYPFPQDYGGIPKIEVDKEGDIWFGSRGIVKAGVFKPNGNAEKGMSRDL